MADDCLFFVESLNKHINALLALGTIDNVNLQTEVTWLDKILKFRNLFTTTFPKFEDYEALVVAAGKSHHPEDVQIMGDFLFLAKNATQFDKGQLGHEDLWNIYLGGANTYVRGRKQEG